MRQRTRTVSNLQENGFTKEFKRKLIFSLVICTMYVCADIIQCREKFISLPHLNVNTHSVLFLLHYYVCRAWLNMTRIYFNIYIF